MTIFYRLGQKLYINITNKCPCACTFCIRNYTNTVGDAHSLWLDKEPTIDEIKSNFLSRKDINQIDEIVFCGYGEPMERAEDVIDICTFIKSEYPSKPVRINTNGLVRLINSDFIVSKLAIADSVSISLNADDANEYVRLVNPRFGAKAFDELLNFAIAAKEHTNVVLTVVDSCLSEERVENCRQLANKLGLPLRLRSTM